MLGDLPITEYQNHTTAHPIGVIVLLLLSAVTLAVPRRWALVPMLVMACVVASAQRFVIASLDFNFLRVLILVVAFRIVIRKETTGWRWKPIDTVLVLWIICATVTAGILYATVQTVIYRLGILYDAVGLYFICRILVRDWSDIRVFVQSAALISVPVAIAFIVERATARNIFSVFGGVPEITMMRDGRLRCQGPFSHPILAGCFWAALMPLIAALWWHRGWNRALAVTGLASSMVVVVTCASSTPVGGVLAGLVAACLFPLRRRMSWVRWFAVLTIIGLHLVMKAPVWHLISRVSFAQGSTGWYRYKLIDDFIRHFDEWWLIGTSSRATWFGEGYWQITNQYVAEGVNGGLLTLTLFFILIAFAFYGVGRIWRRAARRRFRLLPLDRQAPHQPRPRPARPKSSAPLAMAWALGVSLFVHCVMFTGVTYFGQSILVWYLTLAFIGSLTPIRSRRGVLLARLKGHRPAPVVRLSTRRPGVPVAGT
jgi:hypothetical protein